MIKTEMRNPKSMNLDKMSTREIVSLITEENMNAVKAVAEQEENISKACDLISDALANGGRLIYIGAGTSGRLGVLDASECPPTFGVDRNTVIGIIAGGDSCLRNAAENAEDKGENGIEDVKKIDLNSKDVLVCISVAGNAKYVDFAAQFAQSIGAKTISLTSNSEALINKHTDVQIVVDTGAEVVTGSTRMKAGTAQKIVLNILSTTAMIKNEYVYENLMINLKPTNEKLKKRVISIVRDILKVDEQKAVNLLNKSDWIIKDAIKLGK